jgi:hypothetical protein
MPVQRLSSESQYFADSFLRCGIVSNRKPISNHSFERQLTKEMAVIVEGIVTKSETETVRSLN